MVLHSHLLCGLNENPRRLLRRRESRKSPNLSVSVATHVREGKGASQQQVGGEYKYIQTPIIGIPYTIGIADLDDFDYSDNEGDIDDY